ncbi:hypothetical protein psyc5s11_15600 [Clostridium gelidum]|uniref:Uncharacterized protein n=1 Tax=Clostridium gelidum TaxID=704125 RepID=A0ABN6IV98_9CLOT|nr:hypothetical protein [Clostridium gelidum]BCZ45493.1 hypothetical protein psyc5s11_15600 [Clostridium gelidum]
MENIYCDVEPNKGMDKDNIVEIMPSVWDSTEPPIKTYIPSSSEIISVLPQSLITGVVGALSGHGRYTSHWEANRSGLFGTGPEEVKPLPSCNSEVVAPYEKIANNRISPAIGIVMGAFDVGNIMSKDDGNSLTKRVVKSTIHVVVSIGNYYFAGLIMEGCVALSASTGFLATAGVFAVGIGLVYFESVVATKIEDAIYSFFGIN